MWAATILYPSSKHTALVKNLHQYTLQQKVTLGLPLVSREVQPAIIPLKQHLLIKRNQVVKLDAELVVLLSKNTFHSFLLQSLYGERAESQFFKDDTYCEDKY